MFSARSLITHVRDLDLMIKSRKLSLDTSNQHKLQFSEKTLGAIFAVRRLRGRGLRSRTFHRFVVVSLKSVSRENGGPGYILHPAEKPIIFTNTCRQHGASSPKTMFFSRLFFFGHFSKHGWYTAPKPTRWNFQRRFDFTVSIENCET